MKFSHVIEQFGKPTEEGQGSSSSSKELQLSFEKHASIARGDFIPKAAEASTTAEAKYILVGLDPDAPFPSATFFGPILHWIQPNVKLTQDNKLEAIDEQSICEYIGPNPPPPSGPHRYLFLLYEQPSEFDPTPHLLPKGQQFGLAGRIRYGWDAWAKEAKLGPVIASGYFVSN